MSEIKEYFGVALRSFGMQQKQNLIRNSGEQSRNTRIKEANKRKVKKSYIVFGRKNVVFCYKQGANFGAARFKHKLRKIKFLIF